MLEPYRVLDLCDERGLICGQMLADLGADVIQIEPPAGSSARRLAPFLGDAPDLERSLYWWAYARNKRSAVLDLETAEGQQRLRELAVGADFLIESDRPGSMARRGLDYEQLARLNPALIYVSITAYGQDGPKAGLAASDLTVLAAGGPLILYGDADRPPVRASVPQAFLHAGAEAAAAALIALHERTRSGLGQHVDVSAQQAVALATQADILQAAVGDEPLARAAGGARVGSLTLRVVYPAQDGHVSITLLFGPAIGPATRRLMEYVYDEGFCDAATRDKDWIGYGELLSTGTEPIEEFERVKEIIASCTRAKTKAELLQAALERGLLIAPVARIDEVVDSEQLQSRQYFQHFDQPEGGVSPRYPGPFAKFSASPIQYRRRAPRLGEHTDEVLAEPHSKPGAGSGRVTTRGGGTDSLPLAGLKVLDLMWAIAGPAATRMLADYGATVVRVETSTRLDACRTVRPFHDGQPGPENSALFQTMNAGKRMLTLDLSRPEGREVVLDLARWADVVCEAFTPKTLPSLGLDYDALVEIKPDLIMLSTCLMGQSGPLAQYAGYGNLAAAITGFFELTGWPDRAPAGPYGAYTDYIAPRFNAAAILAALEYRRRTGRGQHIDLAQAEAALHFLAPTILDYTANGRVQTRRGNADSELAPHGVYPVRGQDRYIAIAVADEAQWSALCELMEQSDLARDLRFVGSEKRREHAAVLDALIAELTRKCDGEELEARLQKGEIAASLVRCSEESLRDPQLIHRRHFVEIPHPEFNVTTVEGSRSRMSRTPAQVGGSAPTLGRDNQYVLETLLGYDSDRIAELVIAGALE